MLTSHRRLMTLVVGLASAASLMAPAVSSAAHHNWL
jgi:hypothetical protein